jgi:hypothetical protein
MGKVYEFAPEPGLKAPFIRRSRVLTPGRAGQNRPRGRQIRQEMPGSSPGMT